jgi:hypothetical protein
MSTHPLAAVLDKHPTLTVYGFENPDKTDPTEMQERSEALRKSEAAFDAACAWIREHLPPTPRSRGYVSSYGLKHIAEVEIGYITNGLFIAAMLHCGHRFLHPGQGNPNAYFPLTKRRIKALDQRRHRIRQQWAVGHG